MNRSVRVAAVLVLAAFTQLSAAWTSLSAQSDEISARDIGLVEHSGEIFFATVDIVTYVREIDSGAGGGGCVTGYTVLISEVLKGNLKPQSIIVVDQTGCATADLWWYEQAQRAFDWFLGWNDLGLELYAPRTGGCRDGLHPDRSNENQGAESMLAFLLSLAEMRLVQNTGTCGHSAGSAASGIQCTKPI